MTAQISFNLCKISKASSGRNLFTNRGTIEISSEINYKIVKKFVFFSEGLQFSIGVNVAISLQSLKYYIDGASDLLHALLITSHYKIVKTLAHNSC